MSDRFRFWRNEIPSDSKNIYKYTKFRFHFQVKRKSTCILLLERLLLLSLDWDSMFLSFFNRGVNQIWMTSDINKSSHIFIFIYSHSFFFSNTRFFFGAIVAGVGISIDGKWVTRRTTANAELPGLFLENMRP